MDWIAGVLTKIWEKVKAFFGFGKKKKKIESKPKKVCAVKIQTEKMKPVWDWPKSCLHPDYNEKEVVENSLASTSKVDDRGEFKELFGQIESKIPLDYDFVYKSAEDLFKIRNQCLDSLHNKATEGDELYKQVHSSMVRMVRATEKAAHNNGTIHELRPLVRRFSRVVMRDVRQLQKLRTA